MGSVENERSRSLDLVGFCLRRDCTDLRVSHLTPGPASLNLLGTALLVHQLYRWTEDRAAGFTWKIPVLLWIWSQLDPEAWVGPVILVLFAASWVGLRGNEPDDDPPKSKNLWKLTGAGCWPGSFTRCTTTCCFLDHGVSNRIPGTAGLQVF